MKDDAAIHTNMQQELPADNSVNEPFLPPSDGVRYTLVLDLDETLVHYQEVKLRYYFFSVKILAFTVQYS
jgi:hypothetical protein